jgi:hypothetical protein
VICEHTDRDIFTTWSGDTLLREVAVRSEKYNYQVPAFLIMYSCTAHSCDDFDEMCTDNGVIPIFIPLICHFSG